MSTREARRNEPLVTNGRINLYTTGSESPYTHNESRTVDKYIL